MSDNIPEQKKELRIGDDNICPISKLPCDDECCPPGAICNISDGDKIVGELPEQNREPQSTKDKLIDNLINFKTTAEQLAAHKTRIPVVNNIPQLIETPAIETGTTTGNPLPQAWTFEVLAYCSDLELSPDQLIEQHKAAIEALRHIRQHMSVLDDGIRKKIDALL